MEWLAFFTEAEFARERNCLFSLVFFYSSFSTGNYSLLVFLFVSIYLPESQYFSFAFFALSRITRLNATYACLYLTARSCYSTGVCILKRCGISSRLVSKATDIISHVLLGIVSLDDTGSLLKYRYIHENTLESIVISLKPVKMG